MGSLDKDVQQHHWTVMLATTHALGTAKLAEGGTSVRAKRSVGGV